MSSNAEEMRKLMQQVDQITSATAANIKQQLNESMIAEAWDTETKVAPSKQGMFKGKTVAALRKQLRVLKKTGPHKKGSSEYTKMRELQFAIRAKTGWGKVSEAKGHDFRSHSLDPDTGRPINLVHALIKFRAIDIPKIQKLIANATPWVLIALAAMLGGEIGHTGGDFSQMRNDLAQVLNFLMHGGHGTTPPGVMDESEEPTDVDPRAVRAADQALAASTSGLLQLIDRMPEQDRSILAELGEIVMHAEAQGGLPPDAKAQALLHAAEPDSGTAG